MGNSLFADRQPPILPAIQNSSIAGAPVVLGLKFFTTAPGTFTSFRYYRDADEPCVGHTGTLFDSLGKVVVRAVEFEPLCTLPRVSEWVTIYPNGFPSPRGPFTLLIPGEIYTLTVGAFSKYPYTPDFFGELGYSNGYLSVIPDPTLTGPPPRVPREAAPPKGTKFKSANFFIDLDFQPSSDPSTLLCNAAFPAPVVAGSGAQTIFSSTDNVAALSVSGKVSTPVSIGVRFKVQKAGFILAIRWFKDPLEPNNPHFGIIYDAATGTSRSVSLIGPDCASGWVSKTLATPVPVTAGQEFVAVVNAVTRFPLASNYFGTTPKVSGDLIALAGVRGSTSATTMPTQTFPKGGNPWVDVVFSNTPSDCSISRDGTPCDNGNRCSFGDFCQAGVCTTFGLRDCQFSSDPNSCVFNECDPNTGDCSIVRPREAGYGCNDFDLCTSNDVCNTDGQCGGTTDAEICPACVQVVATDIDQGFETTALSGWTFSSGASITTNNPRSGNNCLLFNIFQDVTATSDAYAVTPGTEYLASVWGRGQGDSVRIAVLDASNDNVIAELPFVQALSDWRQLPIRFTPTVDRIKILMFSSTFFGSVYFDDVSICEIA